MNETSIYYSNSWKLPKKILISKVIKFFFFTDEVSPCDATPCLNDGTCIVEYNKYKCLCKPGYKGINCEGVYNLIAYR